MLPIKALLSGLASISFCMANVSGIVTDTGKTPIENAVVKLENGGQAAITGADGRFTLVTNTTLLPSTTKLVQNDLSARVSGNVMTMEVTERSAVEIATYNLGGKALSTVHKTYDAGIHSIPLPVQGQGIYLYKVKSKNSEFVLKGNSIGGLSSGSALSSRSSSSNHVAKTASGAALINDVIAATKKGYLNYRCVQYTIDTAGLVIKMIENAGDLADIEGNVYQTVRIGNQIWMAENLRVTSYTDGTPIPLVADSAIWYNIMWARVDSGIAKPAYCFYNNTTNSDSIKRYGALYNYEAINPKDSRKIAPNGWHVPTNADWSVLVNHLISKGYNWDNTKTGNKIGASLKAQTDWEQYLTKLPIDNGLENNNRSGFSALGGGSRCDTDFYFKNTLGKWWSITTIDDLTRCYILSYDSENLLDSDANFAGGSSVRLVKN